MGRPRLHDDQLRQRLLDAATDAIAVEGPDFSLRPLVASVGTSTSAVYSLFGSRDELLEAVTLRAVASLIDAQDGADSTDPVRAVADLARGLRAWSLQHPAMFQVVFGRPAASSAVTEAREGAIGPLERAIARAVDAGILEGDPAAITRATFASLLGFVSIELLGMLPADEIEARFDAQLASVWRGWATAEHRDALAA